MWSLLSLWFNFFCLLVRPSLSISFNLELAPINVTVHMKLNLHFIFHVVCCSLQNINNFGESRSLIPQEKLTGSKVESWVKKTIRINKILCKTFSCTELTIMVDLKEDLNLTALVVFDLLSSKSPGWMGSQLWECCYKTKCHTPTFTLINHELKSLGNKASIIYAQNNITIVPYLDAA